MEFIEAIATATNMINYDLEVVQAGVQDEIESFGSVIYY